MSLDEQLTLFLLSLADTRHVLHRDALLEAHGMQIDAIVGSIDVCREIVDDNIEDWEGLEESYKRAKHRMVREAAKASKDREIRSGFKLRKSDRFCPNRFSRMCGQIREHGVIREQLANHLMQLVDA